MRVSVWKHECKPSRKGCRSLAAVKKTRFSDRVLNENANKNRGIKHVCVVPFYFIIVYDEFFFQDFDSVETIGFLFLRKHDFAEISFSKDGQKIEIV